MAHDCLVLPEPQDELALILGKKLDKIISMQHDRGVPESAVGGWCVAPAFSGAAVPVAQGCVDTARRGGDLQRDQDPCVQSSNENPLFQESCVGPATLAAALAALDVGSQKRQQKRQPWLAQLQLLNLRKVSVRRSFITDVASDGDCDEAEEVARTASTSSTSHTSCDSDVSTGCRDALDEDDAHLAVEPPALSAPDIGACFDTFLSRCDQVSAPRVPGASSAVALGCFRGAGSGRARRSLLQ